MPFHMHVQIRGLLQLFIVCLLMSCCGAVMYIIWLSMEDFNSRYCNSKYCKPNEIHVGCQMSQEFAVGCISPEQVDFHFYLRHLTLKKHNDLRNKLAAGKVNRYPPAARMGIVTWNEELAHLAFLNTKSCVMRYDECRNTEQYHHVGQNIGVTDSYESKHNNRNDIVKAIPELIDLWFSENVSSTHKQNFSNIVNDNTTQIGCGMTGFMSHHKRLVYLLTCNYSNEWYTGTPAYVPGPSGSKCKTGRSKDFKALCS